MNKKILIGSIIAIFILVGVSFTFVIGYRNVASDVKTSPLFNIRASRTIDEESGDFTYDYLGNGDYINLNIPDREKSQFLVKSVINKISRMDDTIFYRLIKRVISYHNLDDIDINELLQLIGDNVNKNKKLNTFPTFDCGCTMDNWFPGCIPLSTILWLIVIIWVMYYWLNPTTFPTCWEGCG